MSMFKYIPFLSLFSSQQHCSYKAVSTANRFHFYLLRFFSACSWVKGEIPFLVLSCNSPGTNPSLLFLSPIMLSKETGFGAAPCSVLENFLFAQVCKRNVQNVITIFLLVTPHPTICCCFFSTLRFFLQDGNMLFFLVAACLGVLFLSPVVVRNMPHFWDQPP